MADGSVRKVSEVQAGDRVLLATEPQSKSLGAEIECVVRTNIKQSIRLVELDGGLLVTEWHPVKLNQTENKWSFPCEAQFAVIRDDVPCDAVYSFVLKRETESKTVGSAAGRSGVRCELSRGHGKGILINGVECATLGHGIIEPDDDVITHPFLGTELVVEALQKHQGWANGLVVLEQGCTVRDECTGLICDFL